MKSEVAEVFVVSESPQLATVKPVAEWTTDVLTDCDDIRISAISNIVNLEKIFIFSFKVRD